MLLINKDYRNVKLENKVDFILTDIPYNIGLNAYASNPQWWNKGDFKNGKSAENKVERLHSIINEFNKLIENEINESKLEDNYEKVDSLEYCLATLKELKGSDK